MAKFCEYCGTPLQEGASFCPGCGHPVEVTLQPAPQPAPQPAQQPKQQPAQQPASQPEPQPQPQQQPQQPKKKKGLMFVLIGLVVVAAMAVSAMIVFQTLNQQGQKKDMKEVSNSSKKSKDDRNLLSEKPMDIVPLGNSDPLDYSPLEGFHITAEKDAFKENTTIKITPLTTATKELLDAYERIESDGHLLVGGYEVDANLDDDEVIPGEYTVTVDLSKLDINPELYPFLNVFRIADDGSYYQYSSEVADGKLVYRSDQNCSVGFTIAMVGLVGVAGYMYNAEGQNSQAYFYNSKKKKFHFQNTFEGVTYKIYWAPKDFDEDELVERMKEISEEYENKKDELYRKYKEDRMFDATNPLHIFARGKTVAEVLRESIENDGEYRKLKQQLNTPDYIALTSKYIDLSIDYLKNHEFMKMPTGVVDFVSNPNLGDAYGLASTRVAHEGYVEIDLPRVMKGNQTDKNNYLLTIVHEFSHVCQQKYRIWFADSNRYDEMVTVYMEERARDYFQAEGLFEVGEIPELTNSDCWTTLKLSIDKYDGIKDGCVMQHEGYNLSRLVTYIQERVGTTIWAGKLMQARSYFSQPGVSKPLMHVFGIDEKEFDIYYRGFIRSNKAAMANHYNQNLVSYEQYKRNKEKPISKGGRYPVHEIVNGSYSSEIRGFKQSEDTPMSLIMVLDDNSAALGPECDLVPVDEFERIPKGFYIHPLEAKTLHDYNNNRNILEIHGALEASTTQTTDYTLYVWDKPKTPVPSEDGKGHLVVKMPQNSVTAKEGAVDGYILTIEPKKGEKIEEVILPTFFEKEVKIDIEKIYGETDLDESLTVRITLCEFIRNGKDKILGEASDAVTYTFNGTDFDDCFVGDRIEHNMKNDDFMPSVENAIPKLRIMLSGNGDFEATAKGMYEGPLKNFVAGTSKVVATTESTVTISGHIDKSIGKGTFSMLSDMKQTAMTYYMKDGQKMEAEVPDSHPSLVVTGDISLKTESGKTVAILFSGKGKMTAATGQTYDIGKVDIYFKP